MSAPLRVGDIGYLRVRYMGTGLAVNPANTEKPAAIEIVNRAGFSSDGVVRYINEADLITPADALRAVRGVK